MPQYIILAPILTLFALGLFITLRSGPVGARAGGGIRVMVENFWAMMIRLICYIAGFLMLEKLLGMPSLVDMPW